MSYRDPPLELMLTEDVAASENQPVASEWDRIYRMLRLISGEVQAIGQTQIKQLEVAKQTCARLTILEGKLK